MTTMSAHAELGMNRTGIGTSPLLSKEMATGTEEFLPVTDSDESAIGLERGDYARDADPIGSVPPPLSAKGVLKTAGQVLKGESPTQYIDMLGARLAYERAGVRLYEALISKFDALGSYPGGPSRGELEDILSDEFRHFRLLDLRITHLGADPTVMTPSADLQATISRGAFEVVLDPRTTLPQCLEAVLVVEFADNESWSALVKLADKAGDESAAQDFAEALLQEDEHLLKVRSWIAAARGR